MGGFRVRPLQWPLVGRTDADTLKTLWGTCTRREGTIYVMRRLPLQMGRDKN